MSREERAKTIMATVEKGIANFDRAKDAKACVAAIDTLKMHAMNGTERTDTKGANITKIGLFMIQQLSEATEVEVATALSSALVEIMCDPSNEYADATNIPAITNRMIAVATAKDTDGLIRKKIDTDLAIIAKNSVVGKKTSYTLVDPITAGLLPYAPQQANDVLEHVATRAPIEAVFMPKTLGTWLRSITPANEQGLPLAPIEGVRISSEAVRTGDLLATNAKFMFDPELESQTDDLYLALDECKEDALGRVQVVKDALLGISGKCKLKAMVA